MKTKKFTSVLARVVMLAVLSFASITSCKNDDDETPEPIVYQEENPLNNYLSTTGFDQKTITYVNDYYYEFGLVFSPNVKGKIKAITVNIPDVNTSLKVTIWDATTQAILRTEIINVSTSNTTISKTIADLALEKDKKYAITMNTDDYFFRQRTVFASAPYPVTSGNIKIHEYRYVQSSTQTYPSTAITDFYTGDLSFVFQQTE